MCLCVLNFGYGTRYLKIFVYIQAYQAEQGLWTGGTPPTTPRHHHLPGAGMGGRRGQQHPSASHTGTAQLAMWGREGAHTRRSPPPPTALCRCRMLGWVWGLSAACGAARRKAGHGSAGRWVAGVSPLPPPHSACSHHHLPPPSPPSTSPLATGGTLPIKGWKSPRQRIWVFLV